LRISDWKKDCGLEEGEGRLYHREVAKIGVVYAPFFLRGLRGFVVQNLGARDF
jgi:hypothetical protein